MAVSAPVNPAGTATFTVMVKGPVSIGPRLLPPATGLAIPTIIEEPLGVIAGTGVPPVFELPVACTTKPAGKLTLNWSNHSAPKSALSGSQVTVITMVLLPGVSVAGEVNTALVMVACAEATMLPNNRHKKGKSTFFIFFFFIVL